MSASARIAHIWKLKDVTPTEKFILTVLVNEYGGGFYLDEAENLLVETTGYDLDTIKATLNSLIDHKDYIEYDTEADTGYIPIPHKRFVTEEVKRIAKSSRLYWPENNRDLWGVHAGVYFLKNTLSGLHKIGFTDGSILSRISHVASAAKIKKTDLLITLFVSTREARALEGYIHHLLYQKQVSGEWFNLEGDDFEYVRRLML